MTDKTAFTLALLGAAIAEMEKIRGYFKDAQGTGDIVPDGFGEG